MNDEKKISLLEEMLEMDEGALTPDMRLDEIEEWDSMTKLSLIVLMDEECNKIIGAADVKKFITVRDIMDCME